jgi:hypothetical protein
MAKGDVVFQLTIQRMLGILRAQHIVDHSLSVSMISKLVFFLL